MSVFVVMEWDTLHGVFATLEKAQAFVISQGGELSNIAWEISEQVVS